MVDARLCLSRSASASASLLSVGFFAGFALGPPLLGALLRARGYGLVLDTMVVALLIGMLLCLWLRAWRRAERR